MEKYQRLKHRNNFIPLESTRQYNFNTFSVTLNPNAIEYNFDGVLTLIGSLRISYMKDSELGMGEVLQFLWYDEWGSSMEFIYTPNSNFKSLLLFIFHAYRTQVKK